MKKATLGVPQCVCMGQYIIQTVPLRSATVTSMLLQASDLANATALGQLAAAEAAEVTSREQLSKQLDAFEAAQADKVAMSQRLDSLQVMLATRSCSSCCLSPKLYNALTVLSSAQRASPQRSQPLTYMTPLRYRALAF